MLITVWVIACLLACTSKVRLDNNIEERMRTIKHELATTGGIAGFVFASGQQIKSDLSDSQIDERLDDIINKIKLAINDYPNNSEWYFVLGIAYMRNDNIDEAIASLKKSHELGNNKEDLYDNLCALYWAKGEFGKAHDLLKKWGTSSHEDDITRHVLVAVTYFNEQKYDKAMENADYVISLDSHNIDARGIRGYSLFMMGQDGKAQMIFDEVIRDEPAMKNTIDSILSVLAKQKKK